MTHGSDTDMDSMILGTTAGAVSMILSITLHGMDSTILGSTDTAMVTTDIMTLGIMAGVDTSMVHMFAETRLSTA